MKELTQKNSTPSKKPDVAEEGERLEIKRLDELYDRNHGEWTKTETVNRKPRSKSHTHAEYAFIVLRKFNPTDDPTLHDITTTYDIKSRHLRKIGKEVIGNVLGISWTARPLKVLLMLS